MRTLNALFLPHPNAVLESWNSEITDLISRRHDLSIFDRSAPGGPQFENIEVIVDLGGNITKDLIPIAAAAGVKYIQAQTTGLDHVHVEEILDAGLTLAHCPGHLSSVALAQSAMMFILMHAHKYAEAHANFTAGKLYSPTGTELDGLTLGLVGFGSSAQELARRAKPFGLKIRAIDIRPIEEEILAELVPEFLGTPDDLDQLVANSDYLSLHLHLTPQTHHIIDAPRLSLMKKSACLINIARGELVDEAALYQALDEGRLGGAGLDVFAQEPPEVNLPVYRRPNVYTMPHTAGSTDGTARNRAQFAADNLDRYARDEPLEGLVTTRDI